MSTKTGATTPSQDEDPVKIESEDPTTDELTELATDGTYRGMRQTWYWDTEEECVVREYSTGDRVWHYDDSQDIANPELWGALPTQHPSRWWDALRIIAEHRPDLTVHGVRVADHEEVRVITDRKTGEDPIVTHIIPHDAMGEIIDEEGASDGYYEVYQVRDRHIRVSTSLWQGSPDYWAEWVTRCPCEDRWVRSDEQHYLNYGGDPCRVEEVGL